MTANHLRSLICNAEMQLFEMSIKGLYETIQYKNLQIQLEQLKEQLKYFEGWICV